MEVPTRKSYLYVRRCAAEGAVRDGRMVHEIILFIHNRTCAADEQQRIAVVQLPHLVRRQKLPTGHLKVGRIRTGFAFRLPMCFRVDCSFAEHFGHILVRAGFITAEIQNGIAVARNRLPTRASHSQHTSRKQYKQFRNCSD